MTVKLIDANIIIYALGVEHRYRDASKIVLVRARRGEVVANLNTEVLQEVMHYYHKTGQTRFALELFDELRLTFPDPLPILATTAVVARDLLERHPSIQARDAFHAAVVFENRLEGIISADRGLDVIGGLVRFDPKELAV
jgi:predicted nucleic acid-binding protein